MQGYRIGYVVGNCVFMSRDKLTRIKSVIIKLPRKLSARKSSKANDKSDKSVIINVSPCHVSGLRLNLLKSSLPVFCHEIRYKGKTYLILVNGSTVNIDAFWFAGFSFGDASTTQKVLSNGMVRFRIGLSHDQLHTLVIRARYGGNIYMSKSSGLFHYEIGNVSLDRIIYELNGKFIGRRADELKRFIDLYNERHGTDIQFRLCEYDFDFLFRQTNFLAGLVESDGWFSSRKQSFAVAVSQKEVDILNALESVFGGRIDRKSNGVSQ
jgi:hypothetical protein